MSDWQPNLYLEFGKERTQPSIDLVTRIDYDNPKRLIDIGCGPGNSTAVLHARWARAEIVGLDNSPAMIDKARHKYPAIDWICADATDDLKELGKFDIVFSNAAIQWMPAQDRLLSKLFGLLGEGGLLAIQVPCTKDMPIHAELEKLAASDKWKYRFASAVTAHSIYPPEYYYSILRGLTAEIDLWETRYFHIMKTHNDIVKWYSSTGLRPYLDCINEDTLAAEFLLEFESAIRNAYHTQPDGNILFPFTRIFFIAKNI